MIKEKNKLYKVYDLKEKIERQDVFLHQTGNLFRYGKDGRFKLIDNINRFILKSYIYKKDNNNKCLYSWDVIKNEINATGIILLNNDECSIYHPSFQCERFKDMELLGDFFSLTKKEKQEIYHNIIKHYFNFKPEFVKEILS
jgi:hypothetical protein